MAAKQVKQQAQRHQNAKTLPNIAIKNANTGNIPNWALTLVLVLTGIVYLSVLQNGFTNIDDDYYIVNNPYLRDFSWHGVWAIFIHFYSYNYHPLTSLTNLVEYRLFGLNPLPYHLVNLLLHLLNVWLVFRFTVLLSGKRLTALIVAILFAIHPLHVESVAWLAERKDVLYAAFYLAALIAYLRYLEADYKAKYYVYMLLYFIASLLSKSAAVTLPVLLLVIDYYKGRPINAKAIIEKIPLFLLAILFGVLAIQSQKMGGALSDITDTYGVVNRIFVFTGGLASYFIMLVAPINLAAIHYFPNVVNGLLPWYYYLSLPFLIIMVGLVLKKSGYRKELIFGMAFFIVVISVMLQLVTVGSALFAERYSYISYIGLFYIAGNWVADNLITKWRTYIIGGLGVYIVIFTFLTYNRIGVWIDTEHIFTDIAAKNQGNKHNANLYMYWGNVKKDEGAFKDAIDLYTTSIGIDTASYPAYIARAMVYEKINNLKFALNDYTKALQISPKIAKNYNMRGWAYFEAGDTIASLNDLNKAIAIDSQLVEAYNNRGWVNYQKGNTQMAIADYNTAIKIDSMTVKPYFNRAVIKSGNGDNIGAIADYNAILQHNPKDSIAYYNRGIVKINVKDTAGACQDWRKAVETGNTKVAELVHLFCDR